MELEGSLTCSQEPLLGPNLKQNNVPPMYACVCQVASYLQGFRLHRFVYIFYLSTSSTSPAHHILLDLLSRIIVSEELKL
jgi:hypothetical protein